MMLPASKQLTNSPGLGHYQNLLSITGGDATSVNRKNKDVITTKLTTRFIISSNQYPHFYDDSGAIYFRMILIRLTESFYGHEDLGFLSKLLGDLSGIFLWAMAGLRRLLARRRFVQPAPGKEYMDRMKGLGSPVVDFVRDKCVLKDGVDVKVEDLYEV